MKKNYYILSLKHTKPTSSLYTWWMPNSSGYTDVIQDAGIYTQEQIDEFPSYFNNGVDTAAIPCDVVQEKAVMVMFNHTFDEYYTAINKS